MSPGKTQQRLPQCSRLVTSTVASSPTLMQCNSGSRRSCIDNFCAMYGAFHWRIQPHNLFDADYGSSPYTQDFVLPGCEAIAQYPFSEEECSRRRDVHGFCDCICSAMPTVANTELANCKTNIDEYLLFGRMAVDGVKLYQDCAPELCRIFDLQRAAPQCVDLMMPSRKECSAMHLPSSAFLPCPWVQDSGEDKVLECLDGTRCNINVEGWACCTTHRGRARCPRDTPVMCATLCGGSTEYCCKAPGECTPRPCSTLLNATPGLLPITTTSTSTVLPPAILREDGSGGPNLNIKLPKGFWVVLLPLPPLALGILALYLWNRYRSRPVVAEESEADVKIVSEYDKFWGFFHCA